MPEEWGAKCRTTPLVGVRAGAKTWAIHDIRGDGWLLNLLKEHHYKLNNALSVMQWHFMVLSLST